MFDVVRICRTCWYVRDTFCRLLTFYVTYVQYRMSDVVRICRTCRYVWDTFCRLLTFYVTYVQYRMFDIIRICRTCWYVGDTFLSLAYTLCRVGRYRIVCPMLYVYVVRVDITLDWVITLLRYSVI